MAVSGLIRAEAVVEFKGHRRGGSKGGSVSWATGFSTGSLTNEYPLVAGELPQGDRVLVKVFDPPQILRAQAQRTRRAISFASGILHKHLQASARVLCHSPKVLSGLPAPPDGTLWKTLHSEEGGRAPLGWAERL